MRQGSFNFLQYITVSLEYPDPPGMNESSLKLLSWTGTGREEAACGLTQLDVAANQLVVLVCQAGQFGLFVAPYQMFLPLTMR